MESCKVRFRVGPGPETKILVTFEGVPLAGGFSSFKKALKYISVYGYLAPWTKSWVENKKELDKTLVL